MAQENIGRKAELLVIGGSAGSLEAILQLLPALPETKSFAIVLVMHRRTGESVLTELLSDKTTWQVKEAEEKEPVLPGTIYIAPADYHLLIEQDKTLSLDYSEKVHYSRPSIDVTFETAADVYGASLVALLLSGANQDGTQGLKKIKAKGGYVMVQDPVEAAVPYMPQFAVERVGVDEVLPVKDVPRSIQRLSE
jgi:two-component system chemotaxis response regulator CheB